MDSGISEASKKYLEKLNENAELAEEFDELELDTSEDWCKSLDLNVSGLVLSNFTADWSKNKAEKDSPKVSNEIAEVQTPTQTNEALQQENSNLPSVSDVIEFKEVNADENSSERKHQPISSEKIQMEQDDCQNLENLTKNDVDQSENIRLAEASLQEDIRLPPHTPDVENSSNNLVQMETTSKNNLTPVSQPQTIEICQNPLQSVRMEHKNFEITEKSKTFAEISPDNIQSSATVINQQKENSKTTFENASNINKTNPRHVTKNSTANLIHMQELPQEDQQQIQFENHQCAFQPLPVVQNIDRNINVSELKSMRNEAFTQSHFNEKASQKIESLSVQYVTVNSQSQTLATTENAPSSSQVFLISMPKVTLCNQSIQCNMSQDESEVKKETSIAPKVQDASVPRTTNSCCQTNRIISSQTTIHDEDMNFSRSTQYENPVSFANTHNFHDQCDFRNSHDFYGADSLSVSNWSMSQVSSYADERNQFPFFSQFRQSDINEVPQDEQYREDAESGEKMEINHEETRVSLISDAADEGIRQSQSMLKRCSQKVAIDETYTIAKDQTVNECQKMDITALSTVADDERNVSRVSTQADANNNNSVFFCATSEPIINEVFQAKHSKNLDQSFTIQSPEKKRRKTTDGEKFFVSASELEMKQQDTKDLFNETANTFELNFGHYTNNAVSEFNFEVTHESCASASSNARSSMDLFSVANSICSKEAGCEFEQNESFAGSISFAVSRTNVAAAEKFNTSYRTQYITKAPEAAIKTFYEVQKIDKLQDISREEMVDKMMEPSPEYMAHRLNLLPETIIGREDDTYESEVQATVAGNESDDDPFPNETVEQMEASFFVNPSFVCSTPEKSFEEVQHLDTVFENISISAKDNGVVEKKQKPQSQLTHVSCSVDPVDNLPEFDISTVFDLNVNLEQHDVVINDTADEIESETRISEDDRIRSLLMLTEHDESSVEALDEQAIIIKSRRSAILGHIENIVQTQIETLIKNKPLIIKYRKVNEWKDCTMENGVLSQKVSAIATRKISFKNKNTQRNFAIVSHLLADIYGMISRNVICTKRELYYRNVQFLKNQASVNRALDSICSILNVQVWELGILSTSKGLIAGDITITLEENEVINCIGTKCVPQNPSTIKSVKSEAEYVLVVEKDTVFSRLVNDNFFGRSLKKCILVTAKGYPDINTRVLLKKIVEKLNIPVYIIVDADPYGIEIMCTYKFGSLELVEKSEQLALSTAVEWIGIHPTDIEMLDVTNTPMTAADLKKVDELLARPYINRQLEKELNHMKVRKIKAEIESVYHYSLNYFIEEFIPLKIAKIPMPMERISQQVCEGAEYRRVQNPEKI